MSEPVAWIKDTSLIALKRDESTVMAYPHDYLIRPAVPLYTHPPRPVVRLTDKEISNIVDEVDHRYGGGGEWAERFARAVESAVLKKMGVVG